MLQKGNMDNLTDEQVLLLALAIVQQSQSESQPEPESEPNQAIKEWPSFCQRRRSWILPSDTFFHPEFGYGKVIAWDNAPEWKLLLEFSKRRARREEGVDARFWGERKLIAARFLTPVNVGYDVTITSHRITDKRAGGNGCSHMLPHVKEIEKVEKAIEGARLAARIRQGGGEKNPVRCEVCGRPTMSWKSNRCRGCFSYGRFDRSPEQKKYADRPHWDDGQASRPITPANPRPKV